MEEKKFLNLSHSVIADPGKEEDLPISQSCNLTEDNSAGKPQQNWARNFTYATNKFKYPACLNEVLEIVKTNSKLKILGSRHCFNKIADSNDLILSTDYLDQVISIDRKANTVTVQGGIKYGILAPYLDSQGFALHNLASLPHISIAGSISTATHGSGMKNGNLATAVLALEFILADQKSLMVDKESANDQLNACLVGLGAIGVISSVTLKIQPCYQMSQQVFLNLPFEQLDANFNEILSCAYSVSLFTDWQTNVISQVWLKNRVGGVINEYADEFFGARPAKGNMHPIAGHSAEFSTEQSGVEGKWYERLPHFKMGFTPSSGQELQTEYFVAHHHGLAAIKAIRVLKNTLGPYLLVSEIRTVASDNIWMSPCYKRASVALHFTWKPDWENVKNILPLIEEALRPFHPRPHWGKMFTLTPAAVRQEYEKLPDFRQLATMYDPEGKFRNEFLDRYIFQNL